jgi:hypothetical protein
MGAEEKKRANADHHAILAHSSHYYSLHWYSLSAVPPSFLVVTV